MDEFVRNIWTKDSPNANNNSGTLESLIISQITLISFRLNSKITKTIKTIIKNRTLPNNFTV